MDTLVIKGRLILPNGVRRGAVTVCSGRIAAVDATGGVGTTYDFGDALVAPGFIDTHLHGIGPYGMVETDDLLGAAALQPQHGTAGFAPTAASLSVEGYVAFGRQVREARSLAQPGSADILGAHFEGPFINPERRGGMDARLLRPPDMDECRRYLDEAGDAMVMMTLSPELPGALEVVRLLRARGVVASAGHSVATREEIEAALGAGVGRICHLFNTIMRPSEFGTGAWTEESVFAFLSRRALDCEVICDMRHVSPENVRRAAEALGPDRFIAITDSMKGAGLPPGEHEMADGRRFTTRDGVGRLVSDGTLVGSVVTMEKAFANLVEHCGVDVPTAARYTSTNAARSLGILADTGTVEKGKRANLAVLAADYRCVAAFVDGRPAHLS